MLCLVILNPYRRSIHQANRKLPITLRPIARTFSSSHQTEQCNNVMQKPSPTREEKEEEEENKLLLLLKINKTYKPRAAFSKKTNETN